MAHHGNTPASVLNAPSRSVVVTARPFGATRQERRHGVSIVGFDKGEAAAHLLGLRGHRNVPAVRADYRRGRKVRRHARETA